MIRINHRPLWVGALIVAIAIGMAACGGSSKTSSSSSTHLSSTSSKSPTGTPIKLGVIAAINVPTGSFPQAFGADQAAAQAINASGGIKGHPIQIETCNGQDNDNADAACARQLIGDGVVALVGSEWIAADGAINQALTQAHVANIASSTLLPVDYSSPIAFPIDWIGGSFDACASKRMAEIANSTKIAAVTLEVPASLALAAALKPAAIASGLSWEASIQFPLSTTNYSSVVQQIVNSGAKIVLPIMGPVEFPALVAAASQAGVQLTYCSAEGTAPAGSLAGAGSAADDVYSALTHPPVTAAGQYPLIAQFLSEMKAEAATGNSAAQLTSTTDIPVALRAWLGMQVFKQEADKMSGSITPSSFLSAISKATVRLGNLETLNFAKPVAIGPYQRIFNAEFYFVKYDSGERNYVLVPGAPLKMAP